MMAYNMVATLPHCVRGARFPYPKAKDVIIVHMPNEVEYSEF